MDAITYLDNAATSWPKPPQVIDAMSTFLRTQAGNPGRGGHHLAREASIVLEEARGRLASCLGHCPPHRIVLTHGCTDAVNIAIHGVLRASTCRLAPEKPHAVMSAIEHNAVLRTLHCAASDGLIDLTIVPCDGAGVVNPEEVLAACNNRTSLVCVSHASNVLGTIQDLNAIGTRLHEHAPEALLLVDAAQTVGHFEIDVERDGIDLMTIAGHKGLLGPTGTGGLYVGPRAFPDDGPPKVICQRRGGTGAIAPGLEMPTELPDAMEAGTSNAVGFAGLVAGIDARRPEDHANEMRLTEKLIEGLSHINGIRLYGPPSGAPRTPVVLFTLESHQPRQVAAQLDKRFSIAVRAGVHCAPLLHETIGTGSDGGVRASPGPRTTDAEIDALLQAVEQITHES